MAVYSPEDFGPITGNASPAIQAAIDACAPGDTVQFSSAVHVLSDPLISGKPIWLRGGGPACDTASFNGYGLALPVLWWGGAPGSTMYTMRSPTPGHLLFGGGVDGILFNGANSAAVGVHFDNTIAAVARGTSRETRVAGLKISSENGVAGAFSRKNVVPEWEHVWGTSLESRPSHGILLKGNGGSVPATQQMLGRISGLVYDGDLVRVEETDNAHADVIHGVVQTGGSGHALTLKAGGAQGANHFDARYVVGPVVADPGISGTRLANYNSEAGGVSGLWNGLLTDYVTGRVFVSPTYLMRDERQLPMYGDSGTNMATKFALQTLGITQPDGITTEVSGMMMPPPEWADGYLEYVDFFIGTNSAGSSGNVRYGLCLSTNAFVTPEVLNLNVTFPAPAQYVASKLRFTLPSPLAYTKGDPVTYKLSRFGLDAADTNNKPMVLLGVSVGYSGKGPTSAGSGSYLPLPVWP